MDYTTKASEIVQRVLSFDALDSGWKKVKETSDCVVYSRPSEDFKGNLYKSEGNIPASSETVFTFVYPGVEKPRRKEWDTSISSSKVLAKPAPHLDIIRSTTNPVCLGLISAREFVDLVTVTREPNRIFTASISVEHPDAPETKGFVRGFNHPNSLFCYAVESKPNETRFVQYVHSDLGGMLPQSLVESAIPSTMADTYPRLKAAIAKDSA
ncbi:hypothetical protein RvY_09968 [Ramazzottius varieornatus]|uniref:START domain-containing protein n=1 Tax=Ramazzottius varieornatus TaxID=947166 RepID=A0A1D1VDK9_RAMVA|nr:hypothetical protein RvY_09968 [Ramazzottius varieornatus]